MILMPTFLDGTTTYRIGTTELLSDSQGVNFLTVSSPHISGGNSDLPLIGWFDSRGEYIPDAEHFDKEGDPIA
jgi:hypothetical protein